MTSKTKRKKLDYRIYPTPVKQRGGIKVSWNYYDNEADAKKCSEAAYHNSLIDASLGYDFGYCAPGKIRKMEPGATYQEPDGKDLEVGDLFEVCLP